MQLLYFYFPGQGVLSLSPDLAVPLTVLWIAGMVNAVNLIDGLDGLAAGMVAIGAGAFFLYMALGPNAGSDPSNAAVLSAMIMIGTSSLHAQTQLPRTRASECTVNGTPDADVLKGTDDDDVICGHGGDDTITAGSGPDVILGGGGNDENDAGGGSDKVRGNSGDDSISGAPGDDYLH